MARVTGRATAWQPMQATSAWEPRFFSVAEAFTGRPGRFVELKDTIDGFAKLVDGKLDDVPEQAFYMAGGLDEVHENAEKMKED